jgi:hypothetical protein
VTDDQFQNRAMRPEFHPAEKTRNLKTEDRNPGNNFNFLLSDFTIFPSAFSVPGTGEKARYY